MPQIATWVALVAGACLFGWINRFDVWPAAWLGLALLLYASESFPFAWGVPCLLIALYGALAIGNWGILPMSGPVYFLVTGLLTVLAYLPFLAAKLSGPKLHGLAWTLAFPLAFTAVEFLRSRVTPAATWGSIAYSQSGNLPLMQVAAFVGIWGLTFMIAWCASTANWALSRRFDWNAVSGPVVVYAVTLAALLIAGSLRVWLAPVAPRVIRAATINRPIDLFVPGEMTRVASGRLSAEERQVLAPKLERLQSWFLDASRREARAGATLVAWPEQNLLVFAEDEPDFLDRARRLAVGEHVYLAMGLGTVYVGTPRPLENKIVLINPEGDAVISYRKNHPVQGWEARVMRVGDGRLPVVDTSVGRVGTAICFDADFPEFIRQAGRNAADLLIVAANDWVAIKRVHADMAAFRAVETGAAVIRPAASGLSTAVDPWGRVLGVSDYFASGDRTLTVQVPVGGIRTLYSRTGDVFAWLCVAAAIALFVMVAFRSSA